MKGQEKELSLGATRRNLSKVSGRLFDGLNDIEDIPEVTEYYQRSGENSDSYKYFRSIVRHRSLDFPQITQATFSPTN